MFTALVIIHKFKALLTLLYDKNCLTKKHILFVSGWQRQEKVHVKDGRLSKPKKECLTRMILKHSLGMFNCALKL